MDVSASSGDVVAIVGPPGSGRTTVLLALAQRFRLSAGRVDLTGTAALGYVPGVSEPESVLTVAEHVRERALLAGRRPGGEVAWHGLDPGTRGWELSPYERQVLGLILAQVSAPQVVALDGVDEGLDAAEREALWRLIGDVAAQGVAVLVTAREVDEARVSTVVRLGSTGLTAQADAVAVAADGPDVAESKAEEPKAEEPKAEEPKTEERKAAGSTTTEPEAEGPVRPEAEESAGPRSAASPKAAAAAPRKAGVAVAARPEAEDTVVAEPKTEWSEMDTPAGDANGNKAGTKGQQEEQGGEQK
ncbi:ABC transporter ATP-binding protein [Actinoplanes sp. NPDC051475]|uniref:ATP-binding cassette domain-containing protein n=1 Tax=Actinoplanes sp. NPDC051475 TaxID=3157225 RepID=UPI00344F3BFC